MISAVLPIQGHGKVGERWQGLVKLKTDLPISDCFFLGLGTHTHDSGTVLGIPGQLVTLSYSFIYSFIQLFILSLTHLFTFSLTVSIVPVHDILSVFLSVCYIVTSA